MKLNYLEYYRLPWNLTDNSISWLEPTSKCNLYCDGCYRKNEDNHKPLQLIEEELNIFTRLRKCDGVSIAGGDPLTHPEIIEIVRMVKAKGLKPILNTNGLALTKELLLELKKAGVYGFTFHVDPRIEQLLNAFPTRAAHQWLMGTLVGYSIPVEFTHVQTVAKDLMDYTRIDPTTARS